MITKSPESKAFTEIKRIKGTQNDSDEKSEYEVPKNIKMKELNKFFRVSPKTKENPTTNVK
jgi:hypothetical protein